MRPVPGEATEVLDRTPIINSSRSPTPESQATRPVLEIYKPKALTQGLTAGEKKVYTLVHSQGGQESHHVVQDTAMGGRRVPDGGKAIVL